MPPPSDWDTILEQDEEIVWQDQPTGPLIWPPVLLVFIIPMLCLGCASTVWTIGKLITGDSTWIFGLLYIAVGFGFGISAVIAKKIEHFKTWYTLTSSRAVITAVYPLLGTRSKTYPINQKTARVSFDPASPASVYFATTRVKHKHFNQNLKIGFRNIADGPMVFNLLKTVQRNNQ